MAFATGGLIQPKKPLEASVSKGEYVIPMAVLERVFGENFRRLFGLS